LSAADFDPRVLSWKMKAPLTQKRQDGRTSCHPSGPVRHTFQPIFPVRTIFKENVLP
jgi:hypothetical protein